MKDVKTLPAEKADVPQVPTPQPTHFEISVADTNELAKAITDTIQSQYVKELLFLVINRTFKPIMPLVKK